MSSTDRDPPAASRSFIRNLALALLTAAALRCAATAIPIDPALNPDAHSFEQLARSVREEGRLSYVDQGAPGMELRAFRSLLYPVTLAPFLGPSFPANALFAQALLGLAVLAAAAMMARSLFGDATGVATAWLGAFYTDAIHYERQITSEALFTPLLVIATLCATQAARRGKPPFGFALLAGILFGVAALIRPAGLVAGAAAALALALAPMVAGRRQAIGGAAVLLLGLALAVTPGLVRNQNVLGRPVLLTSGGMNFWIGNGGGTVGEAWAIMQGEGPARGELGMDDSFYDRTLERRGTILARLPRLVAEKLFMFLGPFSRGGWELGWRLLWPFFAVGVGVALFRRNLVGAETWLLASVVASQVALAVATVAWSRYRFPIEPLLWPFAACLWTSVAAGSRAWRVALATILLGNGAVLGLQALR